MDAATACARAASLGLHGACITEHVDFDPRDAGVGFFHHDAYMASIERARATAPEGFTVFTGVELNWQLDFAPGLLDFLDGTRYDLVLGSVHWVSTGHVCEDRTFEGVSMDAFLDEWIHEALDLLRRDICHAFAHYDYFAWKGAAFYPRLRREDVFDMTREVVDRMLKHDVSLEVNTSALRKGFHEPFPCWEFVRRYIAEGGHVHLGSDAHAPDHVGRAFLEARHVLGSLLAGRAG